MRQLDLVGKRFGKLLVIRKIGVIKKHVNFESICDCGKKRICPGYEIKSGKISCCGCSNGDASRRIKYLNRQLYEVWKGIKARCRDKSHISYSRYGGSGVKVCREWEKSFIPFYNWCMANGWKPGLQVDKDIVPRKLGIPAILYSPEMCSIVTVEENTRSSSQTKLNKQLAEDIRASSESASSLAIKYNVSISTVSRIRSNKLWN